jgi:putative transposase
MSQRRSCRLVGLHRNTARYQSKASDKDDKLIARLKELAEQYPRYGYPTLHGMLKAESLVQNSKRTYRIYAQLGLQVRTKRCKKLVRPRVPMLVPQEVNQRWSVDFKSDQVADGRRFRILNVIDDYSRECVGQIVDTSISGLRVCRYLDELKQIRGLPKAIVSDNDTEFTSKAMFFWSRESGTKLHFIQPGKPTQNAFVESFNARLRDTCLNQHWFKNLTEARRLIGQWRIHYNEVRPHSSLKHLPPSVFAMKAALYDWFSNSWCGANRRVRSVRS